MMAAFAMVLVLGAWPSHDPRPLLVVVEAGSDEVVEVTALRESIARELGVRVLSPADEAPKDDMAIMTVMLTTNRAVVTYLRGHATIRRAIELPEAPPAPANDRAGVPPTATTPTPPTQIAPPTTATPTQIAPPTAAPPAGTTSLAASTSPTTRPGFRVGPSQVSTGTKSQTARAFVATAGPLGPRVGAR